MPADRAALYTSNSDNWPTPQKFYDRLDAEFGFAVDVCASPTNHKAPAFYALDHTDPARRDGLAGDWAADARTGQGAVWMNPPYGRSIGQWMAKAHATARAGATVVCLVPVRSSAAWWHEHVLGTGAEVRYVRGRLAFGDATSCAPFASAVVVFRPTDAVGLPGPVGVMAARIPTATRTAGGPVLTTDLATDAATTVERYVRGYTPRRLDADAWTVAKPAVRKLVRAAKPHSIAQARLYLATLVGYLADTTVWNGTSAPQWNRLLTTRVINTHLTTATFTSPRTRATRRDTLYRLARVHGTAEPVVRRPQGDDAPDAFLAAGATLPVPVATLLAARKQLDAAAPVDGLKSVVAAWKATSAATAPATSDRTLWASATLTALTEASNRELNGTVTSNQTTGSPAAAGNKTAKPLSRRARLAKAKARVAATAAQQPGRLVLPDGSGADATIRAKVANYAPQKANRDAWKTNTALAEGLVYACAPANPRVAQTTCSYVAMFLTWMANRPGQDPSTPLEVEALFTPGLLDEWLHACAWSDRSKASARSLLRRALRTLDPQAAPLRLEHHKTAAPYTPDDAAWFARAAWHQPTTALTRDLCFIVGLGLGAGLDARDLRHLTPECFTEVLAGAAPVLCVSVPGSGARNRTVPIRHTYVPLVRRALELHRNADKKPDQLVVGKVADRNNVVGPITRRSKTAEQGPVELRMSRLRNTWLVAQMCSPISLRDLLPAAGLASARTITELIAYCPEPSKPELDDLITTLTTAAVAP